MPILVDCMTKLRTCKLSESSAVTNLKPYWSHPRQTKENRTTSHWLSLDFITSISTKVSLAVTPYLILTLNITKTAFFHLMNSARLYPHIFHSAVETLDIWLSHPDFQRLVFLITVFKDSLPQGRTGCSMRMSLRSYPDQTMATDTVYLSHLSTLLHIFWASFSPLTQHCASLFLHL